MRKIFILLLAFLCSAAYSQSNSSFNKKNNDEYKDLLTKADFYENKKETELQKLALFKAEAHRYYDSVTVTKKKMEVDKNNAQYYKMREDLMYNLCSTFVRQADSTLKIALAYKDSAITTYKKAETIFLQSANNKNNSSIKKDTVKHSIKNDNKISTTDINSKASAIVNASSNNHVVDTVKNIISTTNHTKKVIDNNIIDTTNINAIYVVQLGSGNMSHEYFEKADSVETITPNDGIKRFVIGRFTSKEAALEFKQKMINMGFKDAFVRTTDSLNF